MPCVILRGVQLASLLSIYLSSRFPACTFHLLSVIIDKIRVLCCWWWSAALSVIDEGGSVLIIHLKGRALLSEED